MFVCWDVFWEFCVWVCCVLLLFFFGLCVGLLWGWCVFGVMVVCFFLFLVFGCCFMSWGWCVWLSGVLVVFGLLFFMFCVVVVGSFWSGFSGLVCGVFFLGCFFVVWFVFCVCLVLV